jgi:hypothetical protein
VRSRTSKPRKFKKQPQVSSFKLAIDTDLPAGERILTGADLLTSLGLDMNEENIPKNLDVTTYRPESVSKGILESLFVENKNEPEDIQEQINPPQPPSPISVADILKSAVVEQAATPPPPKLKSEKKSFEKSQQRPIQTQVNRFDSSRSRSRARAPVLSHRFRPINADIPEITTAKPLSQLRNSNNNAVINNRRLRVRQRGQTNTKTTTKISSSEDTLTSTSTGTTETPANTGSTRGLSRHRSRVVNQRRINPPSSGDTTERNLSTPPISLSAFGSRKTGSSSLNRTSIPRLNTNRVRVRSRTRQNIVASSSQTTSPISEQSIEPISETVAQKQRLNSSSEKSIGKLEILDEGTTQVNTIETNNNTHQEIEQEIQEDKEQEEEKSTLRPSIFRPRFGTGQRDAVRNRLRNQLLEGKPNPVTKAPLRSFDELVNEKKLSNEVESVTENTYTAAFKTVSPSKGLNAIPISFFTTTPRFLSKDDKTSTTEKPKPAAFLPTLTPLQRVGRSTIGYPVTQETIVTTTEKPKPATNNISRFSNFKRKSKVRPKFGQRHSTTEKSTVDSDLNDLLGTTLIGISTTSLPTTVYSQEEEISTENSENIVQKAISNKKIRPKSAFFSRPRGDFLSSFAKKIAEKADKEKILLESFGGNKKAPVSSILKSSAFNEIDGELKRPRRRFNVGPGIKLNSEENQNDSNSTNDKEKAIADPSTNATLTNKNITDTDTITEKPKKERNLIGPPKLPKGLRLPFDTKRFGALQPKLLSFQIIKPKSKASKSKPKPKITKSDSKQSKSSLEKSESNSDNSVASKVKTDKSKLSLKERLKFGRKTFGALLKSPSNRFKLLPTPAPKSNKNPKSGFKSKKSTPSSNTSTMPPPSPADTTLPQVAFSNARPQKNPTTLFKICSES